MLKDRYRIDSVLGSGGFGVVYAATDTLESDRTVAVKTLKHNLNDYNSAAKRFEREIELCRQIESPHAVKIFDAGVADDETLFYVMEYLEGYTLEDLIARHEKLSFYDVKNIYLQALDAIGEAHRKGIVHRDLKPSNLWLTEKTPDSRDYDVKVLDFGIAKSINSSGGEKLTQTGSWMGSPSYMSPEHLKGIDVSPASDVFALGLIAIEMLTGYQAVEGDSPMDVAMIIISDEPVYVDEWIAESQIGAIISKCVQKDPRERYQNANSLANALRALDDEVLRNEYVAAKMKRRTMPRRAGITTTSAVILPEAVKEKQIQTAIILAIVVCVLLLGIFLFVKFYVDKALLFDDPGDTPESQLSARDSAVLRGAANGAVLGAVPELRRIKVTVSSLPEGATIRRAKDGKELGQTPKTLDLIRSPGEYGVILSHEGFQDYPLTIMPLMPNTIPVTMARQLPPGFDPSKLQPVSDPVPSNNVAQTGKDNGAPAVVPESPKPAEPTPAVAKSDTTDTSKSGSSKSGSSKSSSSKSKKSDKKSGSTQKADTSWTIDAISAKSGSSSSKSGTGVSKQGPGSSTTTRPRR